MILCWISGKGESSVNKSPSRLNSAFQTSSRELILEDSSTKVNTSKYPNMSSEVNGKKQSVGLIKGAVLVILCLQNSIFTVTRRYSQGVIKESYSKHEVLLFGELIKMIFSAYIIRSMGEVYESRGKTFVGHMRYLSKSANKMFMLSLIYGMMNILSYVALRNISAGVFTICAQLKILTTATFSTLMLNRQYSWTKWRSLISLMTGVLLFSEPIWNKSGAFAITDGAHVMLGTLAVLTEVTLSGFASIYFEKVIKTDVEQLNIWERNFQLALGSFPVYLAFIAYEQGGDVGYFGGWSWLTFALAVLGAAGGLLVALSIKYGDAILKTLATTGSIVLSSVLDKILLNGPLTWTMVLAGIIVITSICDYTFDASPPVATSLQVSLSKSNDDYDSEKGALMSEKSNN